MNKIGDVVPTDRLESRAGPNGEAYCIVCAVVVAMLIFSTNSLELYQPNEQFGTAWIKNAFYCKNCVPAEVRALLERNNT